MLFSNGGVLTRLSHRRIISLREYKTEIPNAWEVQHKHWKIQSWDNSPYPLAVPCHCNRQQLRIILRKFHTNLLCKLVAEKHVANGKARREVRRMCKFVHTRHISTRVPEPSHTTQFLVHRTLLHSTLIDNIPWMRWLPKTYAAHNEKHSTHLWVTRPYMSDGLFKVTPSKCQHILTTCCMWNINLSALLTRPRLTKAFRNT